MATKTLLLPKPNPKSKILFHALTTDEEIKYQAQMDTLLGSLNDGKVKKRFVVFVLNKALDASDPNAPGV